MKKLLTILLALLFIFATGCKQDNKKGNSSDEPNLSSEISSEKTSTKTTSSSNPTSSKIISSKNQTSKNNTTKSSLPSNTNSAVSSRSNSSQKQGPNKKEISEMYKYFLDSITYINENYYGNYDFSREFSLSGDLSNFTNSWPHKQVIMLDRSIQNNLKYVITEETRTINPQNPNGFDKELFDLFYDGSKLYIKTEKNDNPVSNIFIPLSPNDFENNFFIMRKMAIL